MAFRRLVLFSLLILVTSAPQAFAEDHTGGAAPGNTTPPVPSSTRTDAGTKLTSNEAEVLAKGFNMTELFVRERWDEKMPAALKQIRTEPKSEDPAAGILATLLGTINNTQLIALQKMANEKLGELKGSTENQYGDLLKRLAWMNEIFDQTPPRPTLLAPASGEEFTRFKTALLAKFSDVRAKNEEFYANLKDAEGTDVAKKDAALEKLRKVDPKMLFSFLAAQGASGNAALTDRLSKALGFSENGRNFLDGVNKNGETVRIHADAGNNFSGPIQDFAKDNGAAADLTFSPTRHTAAPVVSFDGTTKRTTRNGAPVVPPVPPVVPPVPPVVPPVPPVVPPVPPVPPPGNNVAQVTAAALAILGPKCLKCHGPNAGENDQGTLFDASGAPLASTDIADIIARVNRGNMPPPPRRGGTGPLTDPEKAALTTWSNAIRR